MEKIVLKSLFFHRYIDSVMTQRKPKNYNPTKLLDALRKLPNPMHDKKHDLMIYIEGRARSNQSREEHIVDYSHDLKVRDILAIREGINKYFDYRKDPIYKDTFNYYIVRKGMDRGFIKVSIQIDSRNKKRAWIKTIFITYKIK